MEALLSQEKKLLENQKMWKKTIGIKGKVLTRVRLKVLAMTDNQKLEKLQIVFLVLRQMVASYHYSWWPMKVELLEPFVWFLVAVVHVLNSQFHGNFTPNFDDMDIESVKNHDSFILKNSIQKLILIFMICLWSNHGLLLEFPSRIMLCPWMATILGHKLKKNDYWFGNV